MAEQTEASGTVPVSDLRPVPRGVVPRGLQTWLMVGLAAGIVLIILITGQSNPPAPQVVTTAAPSTPSPDRLREYQERLRAMEARQALETQMTAPVPAPQAEPRFNGPANPPPEDPIVADRKRREYESLFASNVVSSRRPDGQRPDGAAGARTTTQPPGDARDASMDEIAEAVVRATARKAPGQGPAPIVPAASSAAPPSQGEAGGKPTPERTGPIGALSPLHTLLEGTVIDTVLTNRLDGSAVAPVNCLVSNP